MINRRQFLKASGAALACYHLPLRAEANIASGPESQRFVWIMLRGAMDGLSALVPYADPNYAKLRGATAIPAPAGSGTAIKLDGLFGMHPELSTLANWYHQGEMTAFPAVASAYRQRSHFDGQNLMENGGLHPYGQKDGWLNRALQQMQGKSALAVGSSVPTVLQGDFEVESWSPSVLRSPEEDLYRRLADLYSKDEMLAAKLDSLQSTRQAVMAMERDMQENPQGRRGAGLQAFAQMVETASTLLSADDGPQIATLELDGWDTHSGQGATTGRLANQFRGLNSGLLALKEGLADKWTNTTIVVMTEFGRTMKENGTGGTDHGTASSAFVAGGGIKGGQILGDWPGLREQDLYEGRDLMPTLDNRAILKALLSSQFALNEAELAEIIFPGSASVGIVEHLV